MPVKGNAPPVVDPYADFESISVSYSTTTSNPSTLSPSVKKSVSRTFTIADDQTKAILEMLRHSIDMGELKLKQRNRAEGAAEGVNLEQLISEKKEDTDDDERGGSSAEERRDEQRLARLEETRPKWLNFTLKLSFHIMVFANFFLSWYDSARLLIEDAKLNLWLLQDDYNCLEIVPNVDYIDHSINIIHALLSSSVLYVYKRSNAALCLAWICSQALHLSFKTFQYFYNQKFEVNVFGHFNGIEIWLFFIFFDAFGSLLLLHKYYDLTDRVKVRAKYFGTTDTAERSLNEKILNRNQSSFIQRKNILRQATITQTYAIIQKIGKHANRGIKVDPQSLSRDIRAAKLALADCNTAENHNMIYMLKKAYAHRLKELEDADMQNQEEKGKARKNTSMDKNAPLIHSELY